MQRIFLFLAILLAGLAAFTDKKNPAATKPPDTLSAFGFFEGPIHHQVEASGVTQYSLQTPLFSNYAEKKRFIKLPPGESAVYNPNDVFALPVGTYLVKTFYYPIDFRDQLKGRKLIETRVMLKDEAGWQTWPYIWNDEQTEAYYDPTGETVPISYINEQGKKVSTNYLIPNKNQCKGCHLQNNEIVPIGIAARHLSNVMIDTDEGIKQQLLLWQEEGLLAGVPKDNVPANADWRDTKQPLDARARAYLDINCGHCHRPDGPANTSGLFLHAQETNITALGIMKTPVAAGRGSGGRMHDIVPGKPEASILLFRMQTNDPGIAMPEIGREQLHNEGIALVREWIKQMKSP
jgi:uncharacterized repeat protein (TIGR03806 family)